MIHFLKVSVILYAIVFLLGCDYNLTEKNFVEIEPPPETVFFNPDLIPAGDTIRIYEKKNLQFKFNTGGYPLLVAIVSYKDKSWSFYSSPGTIELDPKDYEYGYDTLSLKIYIKSGTGSIADVVGMEGYFIEKKWCLLMDGRPAPKIKLVKYINDDGFLVVKWPKIIHDNFVNYELNCSSTGRFLPLKKIITDRNQNFFIDSIYVGGNYSISVSCRLKSSFTWGEPLKFYEKPPQLNVVESGFDSLRIFWNKSPYNAQYKLQIARQLFYFRSANDTTFTFPNIGFGRSGNFELCTRSVFQQMAQDGYCDNSSSLEYHMGHRLIFTGGSEYAYNSTEKTIYTNAYDDLKCFDANEYKTLNTVRINSLDLVGLYSCPTNSSKIAAMSYYYIHIFNNKDFITPLTIPTTRVNTFSADHFLLTDNDKVAYASDKVYRLIDINSKKAVTIDIPDYPVYSKWACITTSQDAGFMCSVTRNGLKLFRIGSEQADEIYSDVRSYLSAYFDPYQPEKLYLSLEETGIEIRQAGDFSLSDKIETTVKVIIRNIDPETGYLLVTSYKHLYIIDVNTHEVVLRVPCTVGLTWLYNGRLYSESGFVLDISTFL